MRIALDYRDRRLLRAWGRSSGEIAWMRLGWKGMGLTVEFPSDWHEEARAWLHWSIGFLSGGVSIPWSRVVPDDGQCSGPTYGFTFFADGLHLHWGKQHGRGDDPFTIVTMPWAWHHVDAAHRVGEWESFPFRYPLRDGRIQFRTATIRTDHREWRRSWLPWRRVSDSIDIRFDAEVGERSGSWKGGVLGCGYEMRPGERPQDTLFRMQREREFR